jgi:hypothetical protein
MARSKAKNPFVGRWRITEMELWDREAIDLVVPAFIEFNADGSGCCQFIAVQAWLDCRFTEKAGLPAVEFSWEGQDEGDSRSGRGWGILQEGRFEGRWFMHMGDDSWFKAQRLGGDGSRARTSKARHLTSA